MSNSIKVLIGIVVVAAASGIGYWWYLGHAQTGSQAGASSVPPAVTVEASSGPATLPTASTNTTNAALTKDLSAIDTQLSGLQSDNTSVGQSINSQPAQ